MNVNSVTAPRRHRHDERATGTRWEATTHG